MKRMFAAFLLVSSLWTTSLAAAPNPVMTVILVRHGEKASQDQDPPLSAAGEARAKELARVLGSLKIDAIYTTQFKRTQGTAAPLAASLNITPVVRTAGDAYAADIAKHIRATHAGQTVVIVGHSNTTLEVMRALGATELPASIPDPQYDDLFVLTDVDGAMPKVVALRYGAAAR
jgi:phosphohistidine phosphatase SixA